MTFGCGVVAPADPAADRPTPEGAGTGPGFVRYGGLWQDAEWRGKSHHSAICSRASAEFRLLVEGVTDYAIYMLDPSGIISNWNAGARRIKGYEAAEVVGRHFEMFYPPEDREAGMPARSLQTARENGRFEAEGWRLRKDGTKFLASVVIDAIYEDGTLIGFAKITRDITERADAQAALHASERQFRLLVSGVTDYALYMLDPDGIVTNWNIGGQRIKGYLPEGNHRSAFFPLLTPRPTRRPAGRRAPCDWRGIMAATKRKAGASARTARFFWASVVIDAIRDDNGIILGFAKITRDISERREAQQNLEKIQRQLAKSQKLDALGQLTGGVAHDFNNLLMIITGNIHILKRLAGNDAKGLRAVQAIEKASQHGASLTRQLLTFARRQSVSPQTVDLSERIHSLRDVLDTGLGGVVQNSHPCRRRRLAGDRRSRGIRGGAGQSRRQRARRHARRRNGHDPGRQYPSR